MKVIEDLGMLYPTENSKNPKRYGIFECKCGGTIKTLFESVKSGRTTGCKLCASKKRAMAIKGSKSPAISKALTRHGHKLGGKASSLYSKWQNMKQRCYNNKNVMYYRYGERGIVVCDEWKHSFDNFLSWSLNNGYIKGLEIDRIDNNKNYEPVNCRFVTKLENNMNKNISISNRITKKDWDEIFIELQSKTQKEVAKKWGIGRSTITRKIKGIRDEQQK